MEPLQGRGRLEWVAANRAAKSPPPPIGGTIANLVQDSLKAAAQSRQWLACVVGGSVDEEFRRHCRLGEVREGIVTIEVDEPGLISSLQGRWASKIEAQLRKAATGCAARGVRFRFGRSGDRLQ